MKSMSFRFSDWRREPKAAIAALWDRFLNSTDHRASFVRYVITGSTVFVIDFLVWFGCVSVFAWDVRLSQLLSRTVGSFIGFFGHKYFSFGHRGNQRTEQIVTEGGLYSLVLILNILISPFVVYFFIWLTKDLPGSLILGKVLADILLVIETYIMHRFVFHRGIR
jgi:putative flippase GtrA